jgi:hypothetical protein
MGIDPLSDGQLFGDLGLSQPTLDALADRAPLWFYVLREAKLTANGEHLGALGGRIVAEVLIGLLAGDPLSFLSVNPTWRPTLPSRLGEGAFTLSDLINIALPRPTTPPGNDYPN